MSESILQIADRARDCIRADRAAAERIKIYDAENERRKRIWSDADLVQFARKHYSGFETAGIRLGEDHVS